MGKEARKNGNDKGTDSKIVKSGLVSEGGSPVRDVHDVPRCSSMDDPHRFKSHAYNYEHASRKHWVWGFLR